MIFLRDFFSRHTKRHTVHTPSIQADTHTVANIMIPRVDVVYASDMLLCSDVFELLVKNKLQAIPVCHKTLDNVKGVIDFYTLSTLSKIQQKQWQRHIKQPLFIPRAMRSFDAAHMLDKTEAPFLLVVDEYGGVDGLITKGLLLRSLTYHPTPLQLGHARKNLQNMIIEGRMSLEDFGRQFPAMTPLIEPFINLNIETMSGLACHLAGRLPAPGEQVVDEMSQLSFRILKVNKYTVESMTLASPITP
jgi:CBS domain containing-hemolysin-like protein